MFLAIRMHGIMAKKTTKKTTMQQQRVVSRRAVLARINRRIAPHVLKAARSAAEAENLGAFFIVDAVGIVDARVDLETYARKAGVLQDYERVED